ncbi:MAG: glycosyltransferase family 4 protein [Stappiaceae bacterium]
MHVAFYAPMKAPDSPIPSGDREIARVLVQALKELGYQVSLASHLRSWQGTPDQARYTQIILETQAEKSRLLDEYSKSMKQPEIWLTYHSYYKAPDLLGPAMASALSIPYLLVEASRAAKRENGPWAAGFAAAEKALKRADLVASLHHRDEIGISEIVPDHRRMRLPPFIDTAPFRRAGNSLMENNPIELLTVAMMRPGDKQASYEILAKALKEIQNLDWHLTIIGDGEARTIIEPLFEGLSCTFKGALTREQIAENCKTADIFVWPAINESFGMVFLEAQAASLAVVAGDSLGVPDVVADGESGLLVPAGDVAAFACALKKLLRYATMLEKFRRDAARYVEAEHSLTIGKQRLVTCINAAIANFKNAKAQDEGRSS